MADMCCVQKELKFVISNFSRFALGSVNQYKGVCKWCKNAVIDLYNDSKSERKELFTLGYRSLYKSTSWNLGLLLWKVQSAFEVWSI